MGMLADSYHAPRLRRPSLVLTCALFEEYLPPFDPSALSGDELELWTNLQLLSACLPEDRLATDMEAKTFLGILRAHRPLSSRLASEAMR